MNSDLLGSSRVLVGPTHPWIAFSLYKLVIIPCTFQYTAPLALNVRSFQILQSTEYENKFLATWLENKSAVVAFWFYDNFSSQAQDFLWRGRGQCQCFKFFIVAAVIAPNYQTITCYVFCIVTDTSVGMRALDLSHRICRVPEARSASKKKKAPSYTWWFFSCISKQWAWAAWWHSLRQPALG